MNLVSEAYSIYQNNGVRCLFKRSIEYSLLRSPIAGALTRELYFLTIPRTYRYLSIPDYSLPINPLRIHWVDTDLITSISGREWLREIQAPEQFGTIKSGDWDRDPFPETAAGISCSPPELYHATQFEETIFFQSLKKRFSDHAKWEDTELYKQAVELIDDGSRYYWRGCKSISDIQNRCEEIDELYQEINENGLQTQRELILEGKISGSETYLHTLANEILIDIGRDGELLFVNGYHRFSIAKLLDIGSIPVVIVVRHRNWVEKIESAYPDLSGFGHSHPDIIALTDG